MNRLFLFAFLSLFCFSIKINAQQCGMTHTDMELLVERHLENKNIQAPEHALIYVPIFFHLVAKSDGTGALSEPRVLEALCALNANYEQVDIQFFISPHPTTGEFFGTAIQLDVLFDDQTDLSTAVQAFHPNALNVLCVRTAEVGGGPGVPSGFYSPAFDVLVMRKDQMNSSSIWLSHEMGHMLSLFHTYLGWEAQPFGVQFPNWPIAPSISDSGNPTELMDGSNCATSGDFICDTPPDYNFGLLTGGCAYSGGAQDPNGVLVDPMENNMMANYSGCTDYLFTPMQGEQMQADLMSTARSHLSNSFQGLPTNLNVEPNWAIFPTQNDIASGNTTLKWQEVLGASHYFVEVDIIPNFASPQKQSFLTMTTEQYVQLAPNMTYFWRVIPFNALATCAVDDMDLESVKFFTNDMSIVPSIKGLQSFDARLAQGSLIFDAESTQNHDLRVVLYDTNGHELTTPFTLSLNPGKNHIEHILNVHLPAGTYMLEFFGENYQRSALLLTQH